MIQKYDLFSWECSQIRQLLKTKDKQVVGFGVLERDYSSMTSNSIISAQVSHVMHMKCSLSFKQTALDVKMTEMCPLGKPKTAKDVKKIQLSYFSKCKCTIKKTCGDQKILCMESGDNTTPFVEGFMCKSTVVYTGL